LRIAVFLPLLVAAALPGCGKPEQPADVREFVYVSGAEPETLDPARMTGLLEGRLANGLFEGLATYDPKDLSPLPGAAEKWEISPDGLAYTFHLRDAIWSNGDPITAHDFAWSWRRVLEPETAASYAYMLYCIRGAQAFNEGAQADFDKVGIVAVDDRTLRVHLARVTPYFLELTAFSTFLPVHRKTVQKLGRAWASPKNLVARGVVNGPFIMKQWRINDRIVLERNPRYWDAANVVSDRIVALPIESEMTALNAYEEGRADFVTSVPLPLIVKLQARPDFHGSDYLGTYYYNFNTTRKPFDDVHVRQAFNIAVDKERLVRYVLKGGEKAARTFVPPQIPGYSAPDGPRFDPGEAAKLIAQAGYPGGKGFPRVKLLYNTSGRHKDVAEVLQEMWKENLNVTVELVNLEWKTHLATVRRKDYQIARAGWIGDYVDPNTFLDLFITDGGNNRTGWSNPDYDALIGSSGREPDAQKRMAIFRNAETILTNGMPIMPIYYYRVQNMYRDDVVGMYPNIRNVILLKHVGKGQRSRPGT